MKAAASEVSYSARLPAWRAPATSFDAVVISNNPSTVCPSRR